MDSPSIGSIILLPFPFMDLSKSKIRPAVILANAGRGDWILCQIMLAYHTRSSPRCQLLRGLTGSPANRRAA